MPRREWCRKTERKASMTYAEIKADNGYIVYIRGAKCQAINNQQVSPEQGKPHRLFCRI